MSVKTKLSNTSLLAVASLLATVQASAQMPSIADEPVVEEVVVLAKLKSAADDVVVERLERWTTSVRSCLSLHRAQISAMYRKMKDPVFHFPLNPNKGATRQTWAQPHHVYILWHYLRYL